MNKKSVFDISDVSRNGIITCLTSLTFKKIDYVGNRYEIGGIAYQKRKDILKQLRISYIVSLNNIT